MKHRSDPKILVRARLTRASQYKYAKIFKVAIAHLSGYFDFDPSEWGRWSVGLQVPQQNAQVGHPVNVLQDSVQNLNYIRLNFSIVKLGLRTERAFVPYVYIAKEAVDRSNFVLFADRTFWAQDSVGYLKGKVVWSQEKAI